MKLFLKISNLCDHNTSTLRTDRQTDGQTDRQTTCDRNTALCTKVHRAVKIDWLTCGFYIQCESKKSPLGDLTSFHVFHKRLRICNRFFTHLLNVPILARLQIFIHLSPFLTKLCHIPTRLYPVHIICAKCPKRPKMRAFRRLRKSLIALLIVVCSKSL